MWLYASGFPKAQDIGKAIDRRMGKKDNTVLVAPTYGTHGEKIVKNSADGQLRCPVCKKTSERRYHCDKGEECGMIYKPQTPAAQQWAGWKTALKPAHEPIVMARKPFKGSTIDNVLKHGVGALNIDESRIPFEDEKDMKSAEGFKGLTGDKVFKNFNPENCNKEYARDDIEAKPNEQGRFPSNVMGEIEGYQKFFYCPKVSRRERHCGFEQTHIPPTHTKDHGAIKHTASENNRKLGNNHPTVKPVALMRYLIQLVAPKNSTILDPFTGSGSTGMAATELGHTFVGCELDPHYVTIAKRRIEGWSKPQDQSTYEALFEDE